MSGIAFAVAWNGRSVDPTDVLGMARAAPYRAVDGETVWSSDTGDAALVYQASRVTPESRYERQPYVDAGPGVVYAAYARLDAREDLLRALAREVRELRSANPPQSGEQNVTDVELIAAAHRRWGDAAPAQLIGDFAYVAYEPASRRVFAARDPMGLRPLYFRAEPDRLLVATEVAQVLAAPHVPRELDVGALAAHLLQEYRDTGRTAYVGVGALPAAHALVATAGAVQVVRTWDYDLGKTLRLSSESDHADALREVFAAAVKDRLRSTHPVAANLSGGMDSGATVATAAWLMSRGEATDPGLRTYSGAFVELSEADERHISDLLVQHYGLTAADVHADDLWPLSGYPALGPSLDDPYTVVYFELLEQVAAQAQADGARVLMNSARGDLVVGDAVFDHVGMLLAGRFGALSSDLAYYASWRGVSGPRAVRDRLVRPALGEVKSHPLAQRAKRAVRPPGPLRPALDAAAYAPWVTPDALRLVDEYLGALPPVAPVGRLPRRQRRALIDLHTARKMLEQDERQSARHGLEVTDAWSDRRVAELALAMPQWVVQRYGERKRVAREAMRGVMPENVRTAVRKIDPSPLFRRALEDRAVATITDLLTGMSADELGLVDEHVLRQHYAEVRSGGQDAPGFWNALNLEMWLRKHHPEL